ncbi:MAG: hypothetical protein M1470_00210 [Bacteroidetes bacterium]|nr:hypothetical protein [Bacteroidota bacterium]
MVRKIVNAESFRSFDGFTKPLLYQLSYFSIFIDVYVEYDLRILKFQFFAEKGCDVSLMGLRGETGVTL